MGRWIGPLGAYGVPLFFTLSGFVLWYGYVDDGRIRGGVLHFYRRRFFRIAPLFYVMLVYELLFIYQFGQVRHLILSTVLFVFNLVPLQSAGFVLAGWSVGVEMIFYAALPVIAWVIRDWSAACLFFVGSVGLALYVGRDLGPRHRYWTLDQLETLTSIEFNLLFFAAGILGAMAYLHATADGRTPSPWVARALWVTSLAGMVVLVTLNGSDDLTSLRGWWSVLLGAFVLGVVAAPPRLLVHPVAQWLGERSFSIYLVHCVVIVSMDRAGWVNGLDRALGGWGFPAAVAVTIAFTAAISAVTFRFVEQPGMRLGGPPAVSAAGETRQSKTPVR